MLGELREAPHGSHDDQCLIGATLVETPDGPVRLMDVRTGDVVLGASGWVRVLAAACTGSARVIGSAGLVGTAGHPVWTSRGWSPLASLRYDDELWMHARFPTATGQPTREAGARHATGGGSSSQYCFEPVIEWIAEGRIPTEGVVSHKLPLEKWKEGFELALKGEGAVRVVLVP